MNKELSVPWTCILGVQATNEYVLLNEHDIRYLSSLEELAVIRTGL